MQFEFRIGPYTSAFLPSPEEVSVEAAVWWALEQPFAKSKGTDRIGRPVSEKLEPSNSGDDDDSSDGGPTETEWPFEYEQAEPIWHTRGQGLGLDLWQVPRQDSACNTYVLEYNPAQRRVSSSRRGSSYGREKWHSRQRELGGSDI